MVLLQPLETMPGPAGAPGYSPVNRTPWYSLAWDADVTSCKNVSIHKQPPRTLGFASPASPCGLSGEGERRRPFSLLGLSEQLL